MNWSQFFRFFFFFLIHSPNEGHYGYFQFLAIMNKASINIWVQVFTWILFSTWLLRWRSGKESAFQRRRQKRCLFNPWVGTIPWRRKWQPTPVFLPGRFHGLRSLMAIVHGVAKSWTWLKWPSRQAGRHGKNMVSFQSDCIILHSHQQGVRIPIAPHPHQRLVLPAFWILAF